MSGEVNLREYLSSNGTPAMMNYPAPINEQEAFSQFYNGTQLKFAKQLCKQGISLSIHTEMERATQQNIIDQVISFLN